MAADLSALRELLGDRLLEDEATLADCSSDFGRIFENRPLAVARPANSDEVARLVRWARDTGVKVVSRGQAHNQSGLSTGAGCVVLQTEGMNDIGDPDPASGTIRVGAGAIWRDVVAKTLAAGLVPPVLTNNLGVSIGGTLSVAGLGIASFREGCQGDQVLEMEVVTGAGDVVTCSADAETDLFDAVRSGLGLNAVITAATLRLVKAPKQVRTHYLLYDDLPSLMKDSEALMANGPFEYLESWCVPCPQGFRKVEGVPTPFAQWFFPLHASIGWDDEEPNDDELLKGLAYYRSVHVEDRPMIEFCNRLEPLFALWKRGGYWGNTHPWMESVMPWQTTAAYITGVLNNLPPHVLGGGHILLWPSRGTSSRVPLFQTPPGEFVMGFGILPGLPKEAMPMAGPMLNQASALSLKMGGKRYPSGWHEFGPDDWKAHFGEHWDALVAAKRKFDPDSVLRPGIIPDDA
ncbi:MAG: FAD-binding protein [Planctomycetota bacterium]